MKNSHITNLNANSGDEEDDELTIPKDVVGVVNVSIGPDDQFVGVAGSLEDAFDIARDAVDGFAREVRFVLTTKIRP